MLSIYEAIRPGKTMTGRQLRDLLVAATRPPAAGPGLVVQATSAGATIKRRGRQIIPKAKTGRILTIIGDTNGAAGANIWDYEWQQARLMAPDYLTLEPDPDGQKWDDQGNRVARNLDEVLNTATIVLHGHDITDTAQYTLSLLPIPSGTPREMIIERDPSGARAFFFAAANAIQVTCLTTGQSFVVNAGAGL